MEDEPLSELERQLAYLRAKKLTLERSIAESQRRANEVAAEIVRVQKELDDVLLSVPMNYHEAVASWQEKEGANYDRQNPS